MSALRILAYHAISDLPRAHAGRRYGVPLGRFQAQIRQLLAADYTFIDGDMLLAFLMGLARLPRRSILLTFDDGYGSLGDAATWLSERGIRGVVFAIGDALSLGASVAGAVEPVLDRAGLARLVAAGFEIGAHGQTHRNLCGLPSEERAADIEGGFRRLDAAGLGRIRLFAYPYGAYDDNVCRDVRHAGLLAAMTVDPGFVRADDNPFRLRRIEIFRSDVGLAFRLKVAAGGGLMLLAARLRLRTRLRGLRARFWR